MSYVNTLLSSSRLIQRRVKLSTCSGLERSLLDELENLSLSFNLLSRGKSFVDISTGLDTIWSIIQNSRICRQLFIYVCDPFQAENTRQFLRQLDSADWASFIPFSHTLSNPSIKVLSHNSKLYHTGMIKNLVESVINNHCYRFKRMQGDELPSFMKDRAYVSVSPKITVDISHNNCNVLADASGDLSERPWHRLSLLDDRIISTASAAVVQELIYRGSLDHKCVIWDPFCHNGSLLFEVLSYLKDEKLRVESSKYPLNNFPLSTVFYDYNHLPRSKLYVMFPHFLRPSISNLTLLGSDPDPKNIQSAKDLLDNLQALERQNPDNLFQPESQVDTTPSKNFTLNFECKSLSQISLDLKETIILTNLYYGNKSMKSQYSSYIREFCKFLRSSRSRSTSAYVIAPKSFKNVSKLNWETVFEFNNNGIIVELLRLN